MNLLIVSDSPALQSGLARVVRELVMRFIRVPDLQPSIAGWFHFVAPALINAPCPIYPALKEPQEALAKTLQDVQPDVVLAIGDPWDFVWLAQHGRDHGDFKLVGYLNIEAAPLPPTLEVVLDGFDALATSSEFGARVLGRSGVVPIHHGVDAQAFSRTPVARIAGRPTASTFVVLLNGQNVVRKNFPVALQGFAKFSRGKPDTLLLANTEINPAEDAAPGFNLADVALETGLTNIVFETRNHGPLSTIDDEHLRLLYSAATVLLAPSMGEGFGLPFLEAMAAGVVPIAPDGFSASELLGEGRGILIPVAATVRASRGGDFCIVSVDAVAEALEQAYGEWKAGELPARTRAGLDFALSRPWERAATQLLEESIRCTVLPRLARGEPIAGHLRVQARALARRHPGATAVVKLGGLSDMLQLTAVIAAQHQVHRDRMVVFTNGWPEVFEGLPGVAEHCLIRTMPQDMAVRSIADEFETCLDVRYMSQIYRRGRELPASRPRDWYVDHWPGSSNRLQTLGLHTTAFMLDSLDLAGSLLPVFTPRDIGATVLDITAPAVAICTGADHPLKAWPMAAWQELVSALIADMVMVIQVGGPSDPLVAGTHDLRGESLAATASVLEQVDHLVTHDNAMAHLAAAVALKTSVIVGPVAPRMFVYPGQVAIGRSACPPCFWLEPTWSEDVCAAGASACLNFPDVTEVVLAVREALSAVGVGINGHVNR